MELHMIHLELESYALSLKLLISQSFRYILAMLPGGVGLQVDHLHLVIARYSGEMARSLDYLVIGLKFMFRVVQGS
jgi:hypothetical protein